MRDFTWEDSSSWLRSGASEELSIAPSLLISEIQMRWNNVKIGDYQIVPLQRQVSSMIGDPSARYHLVHKWPYSRLLVLLGKKVDRFSEVNIGPAMSSIMSFVMRCLVISYNEFPPPLHIQKDNIQLMLPGKLWAEGWENIFEFQGGLREYLRYYVPSPEEEQHLVKIMEQVYDILMKINEEVYHAIIGAMRLYQLALFATRVDFSLAYSLLVASVDAASSGVKAKVRMQDIDPEGKLTNLMEKLHLDEQLQNAIKGLITYQESLTKRFSNFILENLPDTFWEGDYSMIRELDLLRNGHRSGQLLRDLSESMPEPIKQELIRRAEEEKKSYEEFKKQRPERERRWIFNKERRDWMVDYLRAHLDRVLANTFESRSELFHRGKGFPKTVLKEEFTDWIPDVFEEDFRDHMNKHFDHGWSYQLNHKGRILRSCSCGNRKEVKVMLGIRIFERIVHDSILNYILGLV